MEEIPNNHLKFSVKNGDNYQPQLVIAGFLVAINRNSSPTIKLQKRQGFGHIESLQKVEKVGWVGRRIPGSLVAGWYPKIAHDFE